MPRIIIPYTIYSVADLNPDDTAILIPVSVGNLIAYLHWWTGYFNNFDQVEFYAGCDGWQLLTETGYRSYFVPQEEGATKEDILTWFRSECDLSTPTDYQHQPALFNV